MPYTKAGPFVNGGPPALDADHLNVIDNGVNDAHSALDAVSALATTASASASTALAASATATSTAATANATANAANSSVTALSVTVAGKANLSHSHTISDMPSYTTLTVFKNGASWPPRPTSRTDITVQWVGADPSPAIVSSGTGGMLSGADLRWATA